MAPSKSAVLSRPSLLYPYAVKKTMYTNSLIAKSLRDPSMYVMVYESMSIQSCANYSQRALDLFLAASTIAASSVRACGILPASLEGAGMRKAPTDDRQGEWQYVT